MKKNILIPTDFSENAWNAIAYAADLYKNASCNFYILNAFTGSGYNLSDMAVAEPGSRTYENSKSHSERGMNNLKDLIQLRPPNTNHSYTYISEYNDPLNAMSAEIEKRDIALVIMGTKGATNVSGRLFGSHTINVMENLRNCPVLGVPADSNFVHLKEIVFPTSFKTHYKRNELIHLVEIAQLHLANICVLHVGDADKLGQDQIDGKKLLASSLEGASFTFHHISGSDVTDGVQRFTESRDSDMVAFINKKHAFFGSIFTNPIVKELGMFSKVPLLVMHDERN